MRKSTNTKINLLSEDITNLIDSNKTVTKLSTVVKELIENSIDAGSRTINIFIKDGGLSLIEVKDDGHGIGKEDFLNLCKRFNSSKLENYDDIKNINTFGFRGEALSILSYISHMTIISRQEGSNIGHEAIFKNGKISTNANGEVVLKMVPCEVGTMIKVENIFYNNLVRKNFYDKKEETNDIINLISKYSFHFHNIIFNVSTNTFSNKVLSTANINKNISDELTIKRNLAAKLYNMEIHDNLFYFDNLFDESEKDINKINLKGEIDYSCYFTKPSANLDKSYHMIFLNNRLISNNNIKKLLDQSYSKFLIKNGNYFVYLNITCPTDQVDVNVRANKSEVIFLNEEKFLMQLTLYLEENLNEEINSKNYYVGEHSNFGNFKKNEKEVLYSDNNFSYYAKDKVRVDNKTVSIEKYLKNLNTGNKNETVEQPKATQVASEIFGQIYSDNNKNYYSTDVIKNSFYVGYESKNTLTFIQFKTSLFMVNTKFLIQEYFLYLFLKNESISHIKVKSNYKIENIISFIEDTCKSDYDSQLLKKIKNNLDNLNTKFIPNKIEVLKSFDFLINKDTLQLESLPFINIFEESKYMADFLCYVPLFYYSVIELITKIELGENISKNQFQMNENLNFILEVYKTLSYYIANYYIEYISNMHIDDANSFLRDTLFYQLKLDGGFFIRKNIKEEDIIEKVVDTETLYTVFERC